MYLIDCIRDTEAREVNNTINRSYSELNVYQLSIIKL